MNHADTHSATANRIPLRYRPLFRAFERLQYGRLQLVLPDGTRHRFAGPGDGPDAVWVINRGRTVRRMLTGGLVGFAEAYMDGDWDSPDLVKLLELGELNRDLLGPLDGGGMLARVARWLVHALRRNSRSGARHNIAQHYDLGNDFYRLWLDETMTYSAAVFEHDGQDLADAQRAKYDRILDLVRPELGAHLLEIGSGWGGLAIHAAQKYGCRVTSITLSAAQLEVAQERARAAGVDDRVEFRLQDYRDTTGTFDGIVSVEMFEAVGEAYWPTFFSTVRERLRPGGKAALQVITIRDDLFDEYRRGVDFIQRYIFPGGMLPSPGVFNRTARAAGLEPVRREFRGMDYATTLRHWDERVVAQRNAIRAQGFDQRFLRMWRYYLAYCEAGFRCGTVDLMQVGLQRR